MRPIPCAFRYSPTLVLTKLLVGFLSLTLATCGQTPSANVGANSERILRTIDFGGDLQAALDALPIWNPVENYYAGGGIVQMSDTITLRKPVEVRRPRVTIDGQGMPVRALFKGTMIGVYSEGDAESPFAAETIVKNSDGARAPQSLQFYGTNDNGQSSGHLYGYGDVYDIAQVKGVRLTDLNSFSLEFLFHLEAPSAFRSDIYDTNLFTSYGEISTHRSFSALSLVVTPQRQIKAAIKTTASGTVTATSATTIQLKTTYKLEADYDGAKGRLTVFINGQPFVSLKASGAVMQDECEGEMFGAVKAPFTPFGEPYMRAGRLRIGAIHLRARARNSPLAERVAWSFDKVTPDAQTLFYANFDDGDDFGLFTHARARHVADHAWLLMEKTRGAALTNVEIKNVRFDGSDAVAIRAIDNVNCAYRNLEFQTLRGGLWMQAASDYYNTFDHLMFGNLELPAILMSHQSSFKDLMQTGGMSKYGIVAAQGHFINLQAVIYNQTKYALIFRHGFGDSLTIDGGAVSTEATDGSGNLALVLIDGFPAVSINGFDTNVFSNSEGKSKNITAYAFDATARARIRSATFGYAGSPNVATGASIKPVIDFLDGDSPARSIILDGDSFAVAAPHYTTLGNRLSVKVIP